jgi:4-carboxymuconolactone decarboxylase
MSRVPPLDEATLSDEQRRVYDAIAAGPRGYVRGPLAVWLQSPGLAHRAQELGAFCRYGSSLPQRLSELAIVTTASHWRAGYEWHVHATIAGRAGIADDVLEAIRTRTQPPFVHADERIVHRFATELLTMHRIADETWQRAQEILGMRAVVDLVGVLGYYGLISMTINAFEIPVPDGAVDAFANVSEP